jgi:hypothetical protein
MHYKIKPHTHTRTHTLIMTIVEPLQGVLYNCLFCVTVGKLSDYVSFRSNVLVDIHLCSDSATNQQRAKAYVAAVDIWAYSNDSALPSGAQFAVIQNNSCNLSTHCRDGFPV